MANEYGPHHASSPTGESAYPEPRVNGVPLAWQTDDKYFGNGQISPTLASDSLASFDDRAFPTIEEVRYAFDFGGSPGHRPRGHRRTNALVFGPGSLDENQPLRNSFDYWMDAYGMSSQPTPPPAIDHLNAPPLAEIYPSNTTTSYQGHSMNPYGSIGESSSGSRLANSLVQPSHSMNGTEITNGYGESTQWAVQSPPMPHTSAYCLGLRNGNAVYTPRNRHVTMPPRVNGIGVSRTRQGDMFCDDDTLQLRAGSWMSDDSSGGEESGNDNYRSNVNGNVDTYMNGYMNGHMNGGTNDYMDGNVNGNANSNVTDDSVVYVFDSPSPIRSPSPVVHYDVGLNALPVHGLGAGNATNGTTNGLGHYTLAAPCESPTTTAAHTLLDIQYAGSNSYQSGHLSGNGAYDNGGQGQPQPPTSSSNKQEHYVYPEPTTHSKTSYVPRIGPGVLAAAAAVSSGGGWMSSMRSYSDSFVNDMCGLDDPFTQPSHVGIRAGCMVSLRRRKWDFRMMQPPPLGSAESNAADDDVTGEDLARAMSPLCRRVINRFKFYADRHRTPPGLADMHCAIALEVENVRHARRGHRYRVATYHRYKAARDNDTVTAAADAAYVSTGVFTGIDSASTTRSDPNVLNLPDTLDVPDVPDPPNMLDATAALNALVAAVEDRPASAAPFWTPHYTVAQAVPAVAVIRTTHIETVAPRARPPSPVTAVDVLTSIVEQEGFDLKGYVNADRSRGNGAAM